MASESSNFDISGPLHLTHVNWDDPYHRKSVAASLVQGAYILEEDRQKRRKGSNALAPRWWTFFHFQLLHTLVDDVDDVDNSIFGAIYEFKPPPSIYNNTLHRSPRYVIAFRGTMIKVSSFMRDIRLDLKLLKNGLHRTSRSKIAIEAVRNTVVSVGGSNLWLAGHSLGSGMALLAGKTMAKNGVFIETFLFNPPYAYAPIERIRNRKFRRRIKFAGSMLTAGFAIAMKNKKSSTFDSFDALPNWIPCLFVNPHDYICSGYVGYFEHRRRMEEIGAGSIEKIATQNSVVSLMMCALFGKDSEPMHVIPSANVTENLTPQQNSIEAHRLNQWWKPYLHLESKLYKYQ